MTIAVYTARITYRDPDRLDVTRKSGGDTGRPFAPSWAILGPALRIRVEDGHGAFLAAWPQYVADYTAEMRISYRTHRSAWGLLLARDEVTLCCYCTDANHCHRRVLAEILAKLGAEDRGER